MSTISQQIKKYRSAKGITQEQLGQLVGVTTQAVSKRERGGTPDAELLPSLSKALGVSIDALFGMEEQSITVSIAKKLWDMPVDEAYRYAFDLCWAIELGLMQDPLPDSILEAHMDFDIVHAALHPDFGRIMHDEGMATCRISPDFYHFFLMKEPKSGLSAQLADPEKLRQIFAIFADKTLLNLIYSLYTRLNTPLDASLISKKTGLSIDQVNHNMDILYQHNLVMRSTIETASGETYSYMFNQESGVIALLCFADELVRKENNPFLWSFNRTKPLFQSTSR